MKTNTKIWLLIFFISTVGVVLTFPFILSKINYINGKVLFSFNAYSYIALALLIIQQISNTVLFVKFLKILKMQTQLFVITVPLTIAFSAGIYFLLNINQFNNQQITLVKQVLNIQSTNNNSYIWSGVLILIYLIMLLLSYYVLCKPVGKIQKVVERLGDGRVKQISSIGGGKQFKEIEYSLNKINENYKAKENLIKQTNLEYEKYIPKQFLKFLGKDSVLDLELGNQVKKEVTTMFCDVRNSTSVSTTLSLEENFNYINSYLNVVAPIIRKYSGFIDKYLGDGILAVFISPKNAIECGQAIVKAVQLKNLQNKKAPNLDIGISLHTGEVVFGIVGEEERKSPTIISDAVNFAGKMEEINKIYGTILVFSKNVLNNLPAEYPLAYRFIGTLQVDKKGDNISVFESLECYEKKKRDLLLKYKLEFEQAIRYFELNKLGEAKVAFQRVYKKEKDDKVCYLYYNKVEEAIKGMSSVRLK